MIFRRDTCRTIRDLLPLHVGGDLPAARGVRVDEHLHHCLPCFREFRELTALREKVGVLIEQPLPKGVLDGFTEEVMARIAVEESGPQAAVLVSGSRSWPRLAAAAVLLLGVGLVLHNLDVFPSGAAGDASHFPAIVVDADAPGVDSRGSSAGSSSGEVATSSSDGIEGFGYFPPAKDGAERRTSTRPPVFNTQMVSGFDGDSRQYPSREHLASSMSDMARGLLDAAGAQVLPAFRHSNGLAPEPDRILRPRDQR